MNYKECADYCNKNLKGLLSVFVGAGFSTGAGLPMWGDLIEPLYKELGIHTSQLPYPRVLQYIYGENKAEYSRFIQNFRTDISHAKLLTVHHLITRLDVQRIWTTNYDDLLERAFKENDIPVEVIIDDRTMANAMFSRKQIIKMHGSLSDSSDDFENIVLTEEQYENCEIGRSAIYNLLKNDIMSRSFLFLGVSFDDPNMRKIWATIWNLRKVGKPSFLFTVPPWNSYVPENKAKDGELRISISKEEYVEKKKIYQLWKKDLQRYGVTIVELNNYGEIEEFLKLLSVYQNGPVIAGIATYKDDSYQRFCEEFGRQIAEKNYKYHSGGGRYISPAIAKGIWEQCKSDSIDTSLERVTFFYRENGGSTNITKGKVVYAGSNYDAVRRYFISAEKLCIVMGESEEGRTGMRDEIEIARRKGCKLLGIPGIGTVGTKIYESEFSYWCGLSTAAKEKYEGLKDTDFKTIDDVQLKKYVSDVVYFIDEYFKKRSTE